MSAPESFLVYKQAYEETDWALLRADGLLEALHSLLLSFDFPEPNGSEAKAIMAVLSGAHEKLKAALDLHSVELAASHPVHRTPITVDNRVG